VVEKYAADLGSDIQGNLAYMAEGLVQDSLAAGADRLPVIIAAGGPAPARALKDFAQQYKSKVAIVFTTVVDPVRMQLVNSLNRPGGNVTGMAGQTSELDPERLETLFELVPTISQGDKIGVLVSQFRPDKEHQFGVLKNKAASKNLKLVLRRRDVDDLQGIENAFAGFESEGVQGVLVTADSLFNNLRNEVVRSAAAHGLPAIYQWKEFVDEGGLVSHGPDILEAYRKAGEYAKDILGGKSPSTMACSRPSPPKTYINRHAARALGLKLPSKLLGYPVRPI
jgi:putative ABC transport system substrate-binding protein